MKGRTAYRRRLSQSARGEERRGLFVPSVRVHGPISLQSPGACSLLVLLVVLFFSARQYSAAQESDSTSSPSRFSSLLLGAGAGYDRGKAFGEFPVFQGSADCGLFSGGEESGKYLSAELRLPALFGNGIGGTARFDLSFASQQFTGTPVDPQTVRQDDTTTVDLQRQYRFLSSFATASLDLLFTYKLGSRLSVHAGPSIGYRFSGEFGQYDEVIGPGSFVFDDGQVSHSMSDGIPFTLRSLAFGGVAGIGFKLPVGDGFSLEPGFSVRLDIPGPVAEMRRSALSGRIGLTFLWDARAPGREPNDDTPLAVEDVPPEDTAATTEAPEEILSDHDTAAVPIPAEIAARLQVTLDVYSLAASSVRSDTAMIPTQSVRERRFVALLPRLYFDQGGSDLPSRYVRLSSEDAAAFSLSSLQDPTPELVNNQVLNIIGKRLKENPGTSITLSGKTSADEPEGLAGERIRSVADYLKSVWGVAPERITVAETNALPDPVVNGTPDGREEERYVAIECRPADLAAPVVVEQLAREFAPPVIKVVPRITADAGVKEWEIVIRQGGQEVARYNTAAPAGSRSGIPWNVVAGNGDASATSLVAELSVLDQNGSLESAQDTLPVVFVPNEEGREDPERLIFLLPGFQGEHAPAEEVREEAENIVSRLHKGGHIRVRPRYVGTDRFATERSLALATALAKSIAEQVKGRGLSTGDVVVEGSGSEETISGALSTEGRIASRGVLVVVEQ